METVVLIYFVLCIVIGGAVGELTGKEAWGVLTAGVLLMLGFLIAALCTAIDNRGKK